MVKVLFKTSAFEKLLAKKNKSQNWLALNLRISSGYMSQLMQGSRCPSPELRERILKVFGDSEFDDIFRIETSDSNVKGVARQKR